MSAQKRRTSKRRKKNEVSVVGDLFRILFAVSMLVVAILIAFYVFKNINGFSLPNLTTAAPTETSEPIIIQNETMRQSSTAATERMTTEPETSPTEPTDESLSMDGGDEEVEREIASAEAEHALESSEEEQIREETPTVVHPSSTDISPVLPEETEGPEGTVPPDAEIVDGPGMTLPPETVEGGFRGPV